MKLVNCFVITRIFLVNLFLCNYFCIPVLSVKNYMILYCFFSNGKRNLFSYLYLLCYLIEIVYNNFVLTFFNIFVHLIFWVPFLVSVLLRCLSYCRMTVIKDFYNLRVNNFNWCSDFEYITMYDVLHTCGFVLFVLSIQYHFITL